MKRRFRIWAVLAAAALMASACGNETAAPGKGSAPLPDVEVLVIETKPVHNVVHLPGRVQAVRTAEIRARVDGIIERRLYREGSDVEAGAELFSIDPREKQAHLNAVKAALDRAEATKANAAQDVARYEGLVAEQAISQQEYDAALARLRTAQADVSQAQAQLESARLDLDYTMIRSPIAGRAGRAQVSEGALVSAANGTLLTTVEQFDPVYVNFSQSSSDLLSIRSQVVSGALEWPTERGVGVPVHLTLEDGSVYPQAGKLDFFAMTIDQTTGTVALRAEFPNPDRMLLPGQFVNASIEAGVRPDGVTIPQRAVIMTEQGATVMLVDGDDTLAVREIEVGDQREGLWVVTGGLKKGDRLVVDGLQKLRHGQKVRVASAKAGDAPAGDKTGHGAAR
tara:strand:- start:232 stop:1419 length:1188 start_codon:yes stop_codon:yes gene_type:complete